MKIFVIGDNYKTICNKDEQPFVFTKPDTSLLTNNKPFFIPNYTEEIHYQTNIVVRINRLGKNISEKFANRYYNEITIGVDFTDVCMLKKIREKKLPWDICKGFDNSAAIGTFISKDEILINKPEIDFHINLNNKTSQKGNTQNMIYNIDKIISYISSFFTLKIGDLIFTGSPCETQKININDNLKGYIEEKELLNFRIK